MLGFDQLGGSVRWEFKPRCVPDPGPRLRTDDVQSHIPEVGSSKRSGVPLTGMMKSVGMLGFTLGAALIGLALMNFLPSVLGAPGWIGWIAAAAVWLAFGYVTNFAPGHWVLAFLYLMHALVGYVELGTDSWLPNITQQVLNCGAAHRRVQLSAFIWTNVLMFTLRFFAGPIVHKINPDRALVGGAACLGAAGLWLLSQNFTNSFATWVAAVTVYALSKTFYWPTLLGVISERFPKGGALARGLSGGIGMIGAGILGGPGIGYKQDYFTVEKLKESTQGKETYARYMAIDKDGKPDEKGFPLVSDIVPTQVFVPIAGIDNSKLKVFDDYSAPGSMPTVKPQAGCQDDAGIGSGNDRQAGGRREVRRHEVEGEPDQAQDLVGHGGATELRERQTAAQRGQTLWREDRPALHRLRARGAGCWLPHPAPLLRTHRWLQTGPPGRPAPTDGRVLICECRF